MKKTLFITTLLLSAGAMFTSCNKDVENPDMQAQPEETAQVTRAYGDKTPLIEVYYEINDTNPLNALSYEMNGKKFIDLVQLFASNIQKDANGDPCIFFNDTTDWVLIKVRSKFSLFFDRTFLIDKTKLKPTALFPHRYWLFLGEQSR